GLLVALAAAGCGSTSKSNGGGTTAAGGGATTTSGANAAVLGTPKVAAGTPIKGGFVSDGKSEAIDNTAEAPAGQAAAKYVNDYLGGIAGHPIPLDPCHTQ